MDAGESLAAVRSRERAVEEQKKQVRVKDPDENEERAAQRSGLRGSRGVAEQSGSEGRPGPLLHRMGDTQCAFVRMRMI